MLLPLIPQRQYVLLGFDALDELLLRGCADVTVFVLGLVALLAHLNHFKGALQELDINQTLQQLHQVWINLWFLGDSAAVGSNHHPDYVRVVIASFDVDVAAGTSCLLAKPESAVDVALDYAVERMHGVVDTLYPFLPILLDHALVHKDCADLFVEGTFAWILPLGLLILVACQLGVDHSVLGLLDLGTRPIQAVLSQFHRPFSAISEVEVVVSFAVSRISLVIFVVQVRHVFGVDRLGEDEAICLVLVALGALNHDCPVEAQHADSKSHVAHCCGVIDGDGAEHLYLVELLTDVAILLERCQLLALALDFRSWFLVRKTLLWTVRGLRQSLLLVLFCVGSGRLQGFT